ncbi:arginine deiminase-related protein [Flavitalea sp. BT771]|uniref:citrulline utilization hydrolase CtlX n=1 Tax=Flavitalea sp. BT771 TaxID=3063329 RepID=UPI0026E276FD|nr:arginine deiminase-related protein [Flavitalea sp. BT771]MDO6431180.1 arginine deiminase-related protein [Flavitalea sp. BT771]MDV6220087.1 arginine deiminase-related protein [Flavitalea sp. BT771]
MQTTSHILMIRPVNFSFNAETAVNNAFQSAASDHHTQDKALAEFEDFVQMLRDNGVDVTVVDDTPEPYTPDSIFPNNWVSFHEEGIVCLYPMYAQNRRLERKPGVLQQLAKKFRADVTVDLSGYEKEALFLEGTGSMVLDRERRIAYACLSPRTDRQVLEDFCIKMDYQPEVFVAVDASNNPIYHTNVMMCVADRYVVICLDSIPESFQREHVEATIRGTGKEIIPISLDQMNHFAGNMLQVHNANDEKLLVMSSQAFGSLTAEQVEKLRSYNRIVHSSLMTIETNGGGSARCMMAEIHLPGLAQ